MVERSANRSSDLHEAIAPDGTKIQTRDPQPNDQFELLPIAGNWRHGQAELRPVDRNSFTSGGFLEIEQADRHDLDAAFAAGARAQVEWAISAPAARAQIFCRAADAVEERVDHTFLDRFTELVVRLKTGDPRDGETLIGPIINNSRLHMLTARVPRAAAGGCKQLFGRGPVGLVLPPYVFVKVTSQLAAEDIFGPVAPILGVGSAEEALAVACETSFGPSGAVFTRDMHRACNLPSECRSVWLMSMINPPSTCRLVPLAARRIPALADSMTLGDQSFHDGPLVDRAARAARPSVECFGRAEAVVLKGA